MFDKFFKKPKGGARYEPSEMHIVKQIVRMSNVKKGDKVADLGSGDGRIVAAFAEKGAKAFGFEKNKKLVERSKEKIKKENLDAEICRKNFWDVNFKDYDILVVFQTGGIMHRLKKKIKREMKKGKKVISHYWKFPDWEPEKKEGEVYLYKV